VSVSCTVSEIFRLLEMAPFDRLHTSFYWHSIVTMVLSYIIFQINWSTITIFSYPTCIQRPRRWDPIGILSQVLVRKTRRDKCGYQWWKTFDDIKVLMQLCDGSTLIYDICSSSRSDQIFVCQQ